MSHTILLFYKFVDIADVNKALLTQQNLCKTLNLSGRIILSSEGINGTLEGLDLDCQEYIKQMHKILEFKDVLFKQSTGNGNSFPKLSIKVRDEIVTTLLPYSKQLGPHRGFTGKYLSSEELNQWYKDGREFYMVDMRNDYEHKVGYFKDSILLKGLKNFRDLPSVLLELEHLKGKTLVTCCTGGIRCEKASAFLMYNDFNDVYQLEDGIVTYMEKYPNQDFLGKLYVFDGRVAMGVNTESPDRIVVGKCDLCDNQCENFMDYWYNGRRIHGIVCSDCLENNEVKLDLKVVGIKPHKLKLEVA